MCKGYTQHLAEAEKFSFQQRFQWLAKRLADS